MAQRKQKDDEDGRVVVTIRANGSWPDGGGGRHFVVAGQELSIDAVLKAAFDEYDIHYEVN